MLKLSLPLCVFMFLSFTTLAQENADLGIGEILQSERSGSFADSKQDEASQIRSAAERFAGYRARFGENLIEIEACKTKVIAEILEHSKLKVDEDMKTAQQAEAKYKKANQKYVESKDLSLLDPDLHRIKGARINANISFAFAQTKLLVSLQNHARAARAAEELK